MEVSQNKENYHFQYLKGGAVWHSISYCMLPPCLTKFLIIKIYLVSNSRVQEMNTLLELEDTLIDIREWMNQVKLKMNPDKTEYILFGSKVQLKKCLTTSLNVCNDMIPIANKIRLFRWFSR